MRARLLRAATPTLVPLSRVSSVALAGFGGLAVLLLAGSDGSPVARLRMAGALLAASASVAMDDPAAATVAASPTPLASRRVWRLVLVVGALVACWLALLAAAPLTRSVEAAVTLEVVTLASLAVGGSIVVQRRANGRGAVFGVALVTCWFGLTWISGPTWLPLPPDPLRQGASTVLVTAAFLAAVAGRLASSDPARPKVRWSRLPTRRSSPRPWSVTRSRPGQSRCR